jgi:hypothetical protein
VKYGYALLGGAVALAGVTACSSSANSSAPNPTSAAQANSLSPSVRASVIRSRALTATDKIICAYHAQGLTPAQVFTSIYTAPESVAQVRAIISTALADC